METITGLPRSLAFSTGAEDALGSSGRSAGTVDAQNNRLNRVVFGCGQNGGRDLISGGNTICSRQSPAVARGHDGADSIDERDFGRFMRGFLFRRRIDVAVHRHDVELFGVALPCYAFCNIIKQNIGVIGIGDEASV